MSRGTSITVIPQRQKRIFRAKGKKKEEEKEEEEEEEEKQGEEEEEEKEGVEKEGGGRAGGMAGAESQKGIKGRSVCELGLQMEKFWSGREKAKESVSKSPMTSEFDNHGAKREEFLDLAARWMFELRGRNFQ